MPEVKTLRVYTATVFAPDELRSALGLENHQVQAEGVVACRTLKEAAQLLAMPRNHICETGNTEALRVALAEPGEVLYSNTFRAHSPYLGKDGRVR